MRGMATLKGASSTRGFKDAPRDLIFVLISVISSSGFLNLFWDSLLFLV